MISTRPSVKPHFPHKTKLLSDTQQLPSPAKARLIRFRHGFPVHYYPLHKDVLRLGSGPDNDIPVEDDLYVSEHHCRLEKRGGLYFLMDQGSRNGTYLNNILIKETSLHDKCHIQIGKTLLQFEAQTDAAPKNHEFEGMISRNLLMQKTFQLIQKIAPSKETVMIYGETGTGKELIARAIHRRSDRARKPFIVVSCGAIPAELLESELFGHLKGSFTGAYENRIGSFQAADGGTLFLDEIGELPLALQPKLLRALEQQEIKPVGAENVRKIDTRIVSATHRDLPTLVQEGAFRADLFYRLHLIPLYLPSLRDRKEDIPLLLKHFSKNINTTSHALKLLVQYGWPGNVRELKNVIDRMTVLLEAPIITEKDVQAALKTTPQSFSTTVHQMEKDLICEFLDKNQWNRTATALALSMPKTTLLDKIRRYKIKRPIS